MGILDIFKKKGTQEPELKCSLEDARALLKHPEEFTIQRKEGPGCRFEARNLRTGDVLEIAAYPVKRGPF